MHPEVSKELFDSAVAKICENSELLAEREWLVLHRAFPELTLAVRHRATGRVRVFRFRFDGWNDQPPSLSLVDGETLEELPGTMWPTDGQGHWHPTGWQPAGGQTTTRPFMCMVGIREYHTHTSHAQDSWDKYKNESGFDLGGIISRVTGVFQNSNV